jgi:hypothetical protein
MSSKPKSFEFSEFFGAISLLRVILSSIGVTGVLVGIGYIVAYSREHLLGIDTTRVDVIVAAYTYFATNTKLLVLILFVMVGVVTAARFVVILPPLKYRSFLMLVVLALMVCKLGYYDIPFVLHKDVLVVRTDYSKTFNLDRPINARAAELWKYFAIRHDTHSPGKTVRAAETNLAAVFLEDVVLTWLLAYIALIALRRTAGRNSLQRAEADEVRPMRGSLLALLTSVVLIMSIVSVPFTYGKAMWDATLPYVIVRLRPPAGPVDPARAYDVNASLNFAGLLLAADEKTVLLYSTNQHMIAEYSRSDIEVIRFPATGDLIGEHIAFTNRLAGM